MVAGMGIVNFRTFTVLLASSILTASAANGQDRVLLFDSGKVENNYIRPGEIEEFEVSERGRVWSLVRRVSLPGHRGHRPVLLADGTRVLWLAESGASKVLVQYEVATTRASLIDIGQFHQDAFLVAEPSASRVAIVEPTRVTFVDARLSPYSVVLPGPKSTVFRGAAAADGYIAVLRKSSSWDATDVEVALINAQTAEVVRILGLPRSYTASVAISRDAQRLYFYNFSADTFNRSIEIRSLANGDVLARAAVPGSVGFLEVDERRGALITSESPASYEHEFVARDLNTLRRLGFFALPSSSYWTYRSIHEVKRTQTEGTVLVSSDQWCTYCTGCWDPHIDVFDGRTFALVKQVELRHCSAILPLPPR
jgi:hypothetical protein